MTGASKAICEGSDQPIVAAIGIMSRPDNTLQRDAVRAAWSRASPLVVGCFIVGVRLKRTPRAPWDPRRAEQMRSADPPAGQLSPLQAMPALQAEARSQRDVLLLEGSVEIAQGGTSGLKTLPWWRHAAAMLPNAEWVGKCDDDTFVNVPALLLRLPHGLCENQHQHGFDDQHQRGGGFGGAVDAPRAYSPAALFGTIKWGCYSDRRFKFERSCARCACGTSEFAKSRAEGEPANLSLTYEGPYNFALGWFFAMPLVQLLSRCRYAAEFHARAVAATAEPFLRKEDDPLNGFWLFKCLREQPLPADGQGPSSSALAQKNVNHQSQIASPASHYDVVAPLPTLNEAHNVACVSRRGLYRRPSNESVVVHFLKTPSAMRYAAATVAFERAAKTAWHDSKCCNHMVWHAARSTRRRVDPREQREMRAALDKCAQNPFLASGDVSTGESN